MQDLNSSVQRLNMLIESLLQVKRDEKEDIIAYVAKLQKLFVNLNEDLTKQRENTLSERKLNGRILSILRKEMIILKTFGTHLHRKVKVRIC